MMQYILTVAIGTVLATSLVILIKWPTKRLSGSMPVGLFSFVAILFTSGLDVGLIMFPLTEFPLYNGDNLMPGEPNSYDFTNPLAMMFGTWGFAIWILYFVTTVYFCVLEPKLELFEKPLIKFINNLVIIGTCAFTGFLFLSYLPSYINGITPFWRYALVGGVIFAAVLSSTNIRYVKILSISSTWIFFALVVGLWHSSAMGGLGLARAITPIGGYFTNIHKFVAPVSDYHAFYLFWWFAWSIMIGQFVARFVGDLAVWQMLLALLIFPSIPLALWFSVLYFYYLSGLEIGIYYRTLMVIVGIIFVMNSLDSLIRLYTDNLKLTVSQLGMVKYIVLHGGGMYGLVLLYQFTPFKIEWVGLVVIGLMGVVYGLVYKNRRQLIKASEK